MSGEKKRSLKQDLKQGLKRTKLFSSSSGDPGPSTLSTQQANASHMLGTESQPTSQHLESPSLPPITPPQNIESHDNTRNPQPAVILHAPPSAEQSAKHKHWAELKTLANILSKGLNNFGPLKQAVEGIVASIEIFETAAQNRAEFENLRSDLDGIFHDLAESFGASTSPIMTPSIVNFTQGIDREIESVRLKLSKTRIGTHITDPDKILEHYRRIQALLQRLTSDVGFKTLRIVDEQATESRLKSLPHSPAAKYSSAESSNLRSGCTRDTRIQLLEDIYEWACNDKSQKIYWLNGMAGTGKTTIAYSLCERLERSEKLAASFFCSRQLPSCRDVNRIVPTMSYQLSGFSRPFRSALSEVLEKKQDVHNQVLLRQLENLLIEPLDKVKDTLPIDLVVVIDALDECDNNDGVDQMLSALLSHTQKLPMKFFVASRPEAKILDRMRSQDGESMPTELRLHELGRSIVQEDIKQYLTASLRSRTNLPARDLRTLVERSGVLFIYASTVVRYIGYDNFSRADSRLRQILELTKDSSNNSEKDINVLYSAILAAAFDASNLTSQELEEMKLVLNTVVCAPKPRSVDDVAISLELDAKTVRAALRPLFSVLHVLDRTHIVTTLHQSFPDYLLNKNRSGVFHCNKQKHNTHLAQLCFKQMKIPSPPFNICNLKSSYMFDKDVPDLPARVESAISRQLLYACRNWVAYCVSAEVSQNLFSMLREFASERFLLWMEVMNLSGNIDEGVWALDQAQKWSLDAIHLDDSIKRLLRDMWKFAHSFASTKARVSTPHIYISTLTFWPEDSPISEHYRQSEACLTTEWSTAMSLRRPTPVITPDFEGATLCVSYSPDGAYIVSGTFGGTIYRWNTYTGQPAGRLQGHTHSVWSVAYSPDGAYIIAGFDDRTIRIWDAHTGLSMGQPLKGHTCAVTSVAYSPDGAYIVSGSHDSTIRVWDAHTHQPAGQPLRGHTGSVSSVAYSPDGAHIVSGSWDGTIRIWDAHTRQPVGQPLKGHASYVSSVAYSPDGAYIASGSWDNTVRIWNTHTSQPVGQPLTGHTGVVWSVAYSPDGAYTVSCSDDRTIRIWDAYTGQPVGQPLEGHTKEVNSVAYSLDGAYIVSSSWDTTIRLWNTELVLQMDAVPKTNNSQFQLVSSLPVIFQPLILCNLGCRIDCPHVAWTLDQDGWVVFNGNMLIWVPPDLREVLLLPLNTTLMSTQGFLHLDLDCNKLGENWHKYFRPEDYRTTTDTL